MKYIKCVFNQKVAGHVTFAYFGGDGSDDHGLTNPESAATLVLESLMPFKLEYDSEALYGDNNDLPVSKYSVDKHFKGVRESFLNTLPQNIRDQNRLDWSPHFTHKESLEPIKYENLMVVGLEANDGSWKIWLPSKIYPDAKPITDSLVPN